MAISGNQKAYLSARGGIARGGASRGNAVWPLFGKITLGPNDYTNAIAYGSLRLTMALNEQPDVLAFELILKPGAGQLYADSTVGNDVLLGIPGGDPLFGGRILTTQTTRGMGGTPSRRSVVCADYLQVVDSQYLITYDWPAQSATTTILDLVSRFCNKPNMITVSTAAVAAGLPNHQALAFTNERFSTVLRRITTAFDTGGGFYIDPLKVLHVWQGASEPLTTSPTTLTLANTLLKSFAETEDGAQVRDGCLVEGIRTTAILGLPAAPVAEDSRSVRSIPVEDASIINPDPPSGIGHEVRIGSQRLTFLRAEGVWSSPPGTPQTAKVTQAVAFNPDPNLDGGYATIYLDAWSMFTGRTLPWVLIDDQLLQVVAWSDIPVPYIQVPRVGFGAMIGPIAVGAVCTVQDSLGSGWVTGRYDGPGNNETIRPQAIGSDVVMTARSVAQPSPHEHFVQDGRYTRPGALARANREVADFHRSLFSIQFETDDLNARPGRLVTYDLEETGGMPPSRGSLMILTCELTWPVWGQIPRRACYAASVEPADVTDAWLVDKR